MLSSLVFTHVEVLLVEKMIYGFVGRIVGKNWKPRNPVPNLFWAQFRKILKIWKNPPNAQKVHESSENTKDLEKHFVKNTLG